jgi:hypothetical protein
VRAQLTQPIQNVPIVPIDQEVNPFPNLLDTGVSFIDSALPMRMARFRFDGNWNNRRPSRAEFIQPRPGIVGGPGPSRPETSLDVYELSTYAEHTFLPNFSVFFETPFRNVDPDINERSTGVGDLNMGLKWAFQPNPALTTTLQLRGYVPSAPESDLGTKHFSVEPALLCYWRPINYLTVEGELRYWYPLDGTDFAGDVVRYGIGLTYGERSASEICICPVIELVGWTVLDGQALAATSPTAFYIEDATGDTVVNLNVGFRLNLGDSADIYTGYGRALSGDAWFRDMWRLEFRVFY